MDYQTTIIGAAALGFGTYTLLLRFIKPGKLTSLSLMRERFGGSLGTAIHVAGYTVLPMLFGAISLFQ